jgi:3-oxoacyl-[acyl-carrier protein] reductase
VRAAINQIKKQPAPVGRPRGRIIAVASTAGQRGEAWHSDYGAAKGGVIALVRGLAPEIAPAGILINCVAPGWVDTDMSAEAMKQGGREILQKIPLGRIARPEEIAGCIAFLCSPWADFMTGSVLSVNGGAVLA